MKKSLQELFNVYISECQYTRNLSHQTIRGYTEVFRQFSILTGITDATDLSRAKVVEFFHLLQVRKRIVGKGIEKTGIKSSTIKTYWGKLNSFFSWLVQNRYILENPILTIRPPEPVYDDKRSLTRGEVNRIISVIMVYSHTLFIQKRDLVMVSLLLFCGLRKNELLTLEIRDINIEKRIITIRGETSKSKHTRQIPMNVSLRMHLEEYFEARKKHGYTAPGLIVSGREDRTFTAHGLKQWVNRISTLSKVKFHLHRFRHTFACNLAHQNVSAVKIQKLMGHTDLRMTERYVRSLTVDDMRDDINKITLDSLY